MTSWLVVGLSDLLTGVAYVLIAAFIIRGLWFTRHLRRNLLAAATAAIFLSCSAHHFLHGLELMVGSSPAHIAMMRQMMSGPLTVVITATTAVVGVAYLGLRHSFSRLLRSPAMFDDMTEVRYRQLVANLPHAAVFVVDPTMHLVLAEGQALADAGTSASAMEGRALSAVREDRVFAEIEPLCREALTGKSTDFDSIVVMTGSTFRTRVSPLHDEGGDVIGALVVAEDVTAERAAQDELTTAKAFSDAILSASPDITTITDLAAGTASWTSRSVWELIGGTPDMDAKFGLPTMQNVMLQDDIDVVLAANAKVATLDDGETVTVRYRVRALDGRYRWLSRRTTPFVRSADGVVLQGLSSVRDVTDIVFAEEEIRHAALHDPLTGLANRALLLDRITSALDRAERAETEVVVLFCDLDGFKRINDTDGHDSGDAVLVEVAHRLADVLRQGDSIARVGGDEFVIVLDPTTTTESAAELDPHGRAQSEQLAKLISERIRAALAVPIVYQGRTYVVSTSIGVTIADRGSVAGDVLRDADTAIYRAKILGKNRVEVFDSALRARALERGRIERALRTALDPDDPRPSAFTVAYQPVHDLGSGRLVGFEALARLADGDGGSVSPEAFIAVAEDTGLIADLGARVLDVALRALVCWRAAHPHQVPVTMSVNLSARQVQRPGLTDEVTAALDRFGLVATDLVLELTESVLLESAASAMRQIRDLHEAGVRIAIDDFGTGYASLRYLTTLPVDLVKVGRSFTAGMTTDHTSASIVRAVATLTADLDLGCIVQGIETVEQLLALPFGVQGQGYLLGRPTSAPAADWLPAVPVA